MEQSARNNLPRAPSSSWAKVIASTTPSPTAVPVPEVEAVPALTYGFSDDIGQGWRVFRLVDILIGYTWRYTAGPYVQSVYFKRDGTAVNLQKKNYKWQWKVLGNRRLTIIYGDGNSCNFDFGDLSSLKVIGRTQDNSKRTLSAISR